MNRQQVIQAGRRWVADLVMRGRNALRLPARGTSGQPFSTAADALPGADRRQPAARTHAVSPVAPAKRVALVILPTLLLASTVPAYRWLGARLGPKKGYFTGFLLYWTGWCLLVPLWVVGPRGMRNLFRDVRPRVGRPAGVELFCLALPPLVGYSFAFPRQLRKASRASPTHSAFQHNGTLPGCAKGRARQVRGAHLLRDTPHYLSLALLHESRGQHSVLSR